MNLRRVRIAAQLLALGLVVWWFVVPQLRGTSSSLHQLFDVDSSWLPVALAAELGSLAAYTFCTRAVLGHHARPSYPQIACIDLSSIGLGHCLPDGGAAGTALRERSTRAPRYDAAPGPWVTTKTSCPRTSRPSTRCRAVSATSSARGTNDSATTAILMPRA